MKTTKSFRCHRCKRRIRRRGPNHKYCRACAGAAALDRNLQYARANRDAIRVYNTEYQREYRARKRAKSLAA